jgi:hypothetical protein
VSSLDGKIGKVIRDQIPHSQRSWHQGHSQRINYRAHLYRLLVSQIKKWIVWFKQGEKTYEDQSQTVRLSHFLGQPLRDFLQELPFTTAIMIAQHFDESRHAIKQILQWELGR